jgi:Xaa-Pro aminopeptidase
MAIPKRAKSSVRKKKSSFEEQLLRMVKTPREIDVIKKSAKITDSCVDVIEKELRRRSVTEKQLAATIDRNIRRQGAELAFPTIAVSGKRAVFIHGKPTNAKIRGMGYVDCGAKYRGYCTDITVPFVKGDMGEKQRRILGTTIRAYREMVKVPRLGMLCWEAQERFEKFIRKNKYAVRHSLGHGIGLDIHELPSITKPRKGRKMRPARRRLWEKLRMIRFEKDQVFTIEPGIYVKGIGGCRYENDFLMTKRGPVALTHSRLIQVKLK